MFLQEDYLPSDIRDLISIIHNKSNIVQYDKDIASLSVKGLVITRKCEFGYRNQHYCYVTFKGLWVSFVYEKKFYK